MPFFVIFKARRLIISSMKNYDVYKNQHLLEGVAKSGYNLMGQCIYDLKGKRVQDDKLESLFNRIRKLTNKNSRVSSLILNMLTCLEQD